MAMIFFEIAISWHTIYALYVEAVLKYVGPSKGTADSLHDEHSCYLGRWMHKVETEFSALREFENLRLKHNRFHEIATAAIGAASLNEAAPASLDESIGAVRLSSHSVVDAILSLERAVTREEGKSLEAPTQLECPVRKYRLGIPIIDDQHYALVGLARKLMERPSEKLSDAENIELIAELTALTHLHFMTEEIYMQSIQVPPLELKKHQAEHKQILDRLTGLSTNAGKFETLTTADIIPQFARWFSGHLIDYDYSLKKY